MVSTTGLGAKKITEVKIGDQREIVAAGMKLIVYLAGIQGLYIIRVGLANEKRNSKIR